MSTLISRRSCWYSIGNNGSKPCKTLHGKGHAIEPVILISKNSRFNDSTKGVLFMLFLKFIFKGNPQYFFWVPNNLYLFSEFPTTNLYYMFEITRNRGNTSHSVLCSHINFSFSNLQSYYCSTNMEIVWVSLCCNTVIGTSLTPFQPQNAQIKVFFLKMYSCALKFCAGTTLHLWWSIGSNV